MIKIYEPVIDPETGKATIATELDPEEIKQLLMGALMMLLQQGLVPRSIAHHFEGQEEEQPEEQALFEGDPQQPFQTTVQVEPQKIATVTELTEEQQKALLMNLNTKDMPRA